MFRSFLIDTNRILNSCSESLITLAFTNSMLVLPCLGNNRNVFSYREIKKGIMKNNSQPGSPALWSLPESVLERLNADRDKSAYSEFFLCGLYCSVAIIFLVFFGVAALLREEMVFANVIFGFVAATLISYFLIWLSGYLFLANHLVVILMAALCLYLFYTGGSDGTGPIYYFIFPSVALFSQGNRVGTYSIIVLLLLTLFVYNTNLFGFNSTQYSFVYISRIFVIFLIVSILTFLFSFFKKQAELELLLSQEDLEELSFTDRLTNLVNRNLMEKLLITESNRYKRYNSPFSIMLLKIEDFNRLNESYGNHFSDTVLKSMTEIFNKVLRSQDTVCRWSRQEFLFLLPETSGGGAATLGDRLRKEIENYAFKFDGKEAEISADISFSQIEDEDISKTIQKLDNNFQLTNIVSSNSDANSGFSPMV
jgi:diguanylate cyclase (GGDEF)-like protein